MVPMGKYSLFGMYIYHRILVTLGVNKFHPTDTTYLKIAPVGDIHGTEDLV